MQLWDPIQRGGIRFVKCRACRLEFFMDDVEYIEAHERGHGTALQTQTNRTNMNETEVPKLDRTMDLYRELAKKAIAWVLADRVCDDHAAIVNRTESEIDEHLRGGESASERDRELLKKLEYEKIGLQLACQRETKCDEEMRKMAQRLVDELESRSSTDQATSTDQTATQTTDRVLHMLSGGHALCAFSHEVPSRWPAGHRWTSIAELRQGVTKIEDLSCKTCAAGARALLTGKTPQRFSYGSKVHAVCRRIGKGDYTDLAIQERAQHDGKIGTVIDHSDSHGLCYEVRFENGTAWFDPEELSPV